MLKSKWTRRLATATTLLVVGIACAGLFAQAEEEAKPAEAKPAKTGQWRGEPGSLLVRPTSGGISTVETIKDDDELGAVKIRVPLETKYYDELWKDKQLAGREYHLVALEPVDSYISFPYLVRMRTYQAGDPSSKLREVEFSIVDDTGEADADIAGLRQYITDLKSADLKFRLTEPKETSTAKRPTVVVQLDSNQLTGKLLAQNVGNRGLTLIARPTKQTVDAVGEKTIPGTYQIRDWMVLRSDPNTKQVRLWLQEKALNKDEIESQIEELQRKKFRIQLNGLVGSGTPAIAADASSAAPIGANVLSQPRRIEVRLDPKLVDEKLLEANIGNRMIQVLAIRRGADPGTAGPVDVEYQVATGCQLLEVKHVGIPHPTTPKAFVGHPVAVLLASKPSPQHPDRLPTQEEIDEALEAGARFRLVGLVDSKSASTPNALASGVKVEQGSLTSSSAPAKIRVPLDSNTFSSEWLQHNKGNQSITLFAEGTGITKASFGRHQIGGVLRLGKSLPRSPGESILLVDLELEPSDDPARQDAVTKSWQEQVDSYERMKFRFVLEGLVPLGEPVPVKVTPGLFRNVGVGRHELRVLLDPQTVSRDELEKDPETRRFTLRCTSPPLTIAKVCRVESTRKVQRDGNDYLEVELVTYAKKTEGQERIDSLFAAGSRFQLLSNDASTIGMSGFTPAPYGGPNYGSAPTTPYVSPPLNPSGAAPALSGSRFSPPQATNANGPTQRFGIGSVNRLTHPAAAPSNSASNSPYQGPNYGQATATPYGGTLAPTGSAPAPYTQARNSQFKPPGVPGSNAWAPGYANPSNPYAAAPAAVPVSPPGATNAYVPATGYSSAASPHFSIPAPPLTAPSGASPNYSAASNYAVPAYAPNAFASPKYDPTSPLPASAKINRPLEQKKRQAIAKLEKAKTDAEKAKAREELRQTLTEVFTADMQQRDKQARDIEARVKKLREQYDAREDAKDEIIELQLQLLEKQAAGLDFPSSEPLR